MSGTAERRILCVFPIYEPSLGTFEFAYDVAAGVSAFMPPQGLLVIAAALPEGWRVRFIDENIAPATQADFSWADAVFVSGMHIQRRQIQDICARAHAKGKPVALGGPSVSASPELYPEADFLHIGELGDATEALFAALARDCARPQRQIRFETRERLALDSFPIPAYELVDLQRYFLGSLHFSSGCPYTCEFCDIPSLYGRVPRLKSPQRILKELDKLRACGLKSAVYFVDDNFIGNRRAARELLPHLVSWQERNGFPFVLACEATLNIARYDDILDAMRAAHFTTIFCGVETPEEEALHSMSKDQNLTLPIVEAVRRLNAKGLEVVAGVIMGLDTDGPQTAERIVAFIEETQIPMLTLNLLQALPRSPLWDRLEREGRLSDSADRESNVIFVRPYEEVTADFRKCLAYAYDPTRLFARFEHQSAVTYPYRRPRVYARGQFTARDALRGFSMMAMIVWKMGVLADYRKVFWAFAWPRLKAGKIEELISAAVISKHLIAFARKACAGELNASHYSAKLRAEIGGERLAAE